MPGAPYTILLSLYFRNFFSGEQGEQSCNSLPINGSRVHIGCSLACSPGGHAGRERAAGQKRPFEKGLNPSRDGWPVNAVCTHLRA